MNFKINVVQNIEPHKVTSYDSKVKSSLSNYAERKSLGNKNLKNVLRKLAAE